MAGDRPPDPACRVCGEPFGDDHGFAARCAVTGDEFRVARCASCGVLATRPVPADLGAYYSSSYRRYAGLTGTVLRFLVQSRVRRWLAGRRPAVAFEIGAGNGWMLGELARHCGMVIGTEREPGVAREAARNAGAPVIVGDIAAISPSVTPDLIVLFHVLEHLENPLATVRQCAARMSVDSELIVSVPNAASWQARLFGPDWFHLDVPRHVHHFSPATLRVLMQRAGLTVVSISTVSLEHDPYGWVQSALNAMGFRANALTSGLSQGATTGGNGGLASRLVALGLVLPALILAMASWLAGAGAVVTAHATRSHRPAA